MANIALLNRCNLRCPYCFADSYTGEARQDIDLNTLVSLLDFCASDGKVGIIGGEPLLHNNISEIMEILRHDRRFHSITIFTNGIFLEKIADFLSYPAFSLLINVNSRRDIGEKSFEKIKSNISLCLEKMDKERVGLGINVYEENQDFSDLLELISGFGFDKVRVSVVIPQNKGEGGIPYFMRMKPTLMRLYASLKELGVASCYDCNVIPECVYTDEEKAFLNSLPFKNQLERLIFVGKRPICSPVIDLYPDKTATRCFGMYDGGRVKIDGFETIDDLKNYFFKEIDCRLVNTPSCDGCKDCYKYKCFGCYGGCLCYKEVSL
ncbi:MAG: radical SAM protein [Clostridia bacterium]|nr:radical SAM protein [Clostridia bacterium]